MSEIDRAADIQERHVGGIIDKLGIRFVTAVPDRVVATMEVGPHNHQPSGILHGGASVTLAETLASIGAFINVDSSKYYVVGLEINANHVKAVRSGTVTGEATPLHRGRTTQIWDIKIRDEEGKLTCISRCTMAVVAIEASRQ